jgi:hypothetical protein
MKIAIIGADIFGLALAHFLHEEYRDNFSIYIVEERAEIGFPCSGSGLLENHKKWLEILDTWLTSPTFLPKLNQGIGLAFRRDWLEKDLALSLVSKDITINVRTTVVSQTKTSLTLVGVGGRSSIWEGDIVIDCRTESNSPLFGVISNSPQESGWQRNDGTWEGWYENLPTDFNILQILNSSSSIVSENGIDFSLELAKNNFLKISNTYLNG